MYYFHVIVICLSLLGPGHGWTKDEFIHLLTIVCRMNFEDFKLINLELDGEMLLKFDVLFFQI